MSGLRATSEDDDTFLNVEKGCLFLLTAIAMVVKEPDQETNIGGGWHIDHSYDEAPAMGSILVAKALPENGGDTWFVSMYDAFSGLSDGLKCTLRGLRAVHSARHLFGTGKGYTQTTDVAGSRIGNPEAADEPAHNRVRCDHVELRPVVARRRDHAGHGGQLAERNFTWQLGPALVCTLLCQMLAVRVDGVFIVIGEQDDVIAIARCLRGKAVMVGGGVRAAGQEHQQTVSCVVALIHPDPVVLQLPHNFGWKRDTARC